MNIAERIESRFRDLFAENPLMVRSPGRVNLIGEHTDYNDGYVLPAAIEKAMYFALSPRTDHTCSVYSLDKNDSIEFNTDHCVRSKKMWPNYIMGVVDQLVRSGYSPGGFNCVFGGDIPIGAGLSSSAALETGLAFGLNEIFHFGVDKMSLVKLAQKAENEFVGVKCGIMDQYASIFGELNNVLRIDCRSLESTYYPFNHDVAIVLFDSRVKHSLASTEYNTRRKECALGVNIIQKTHPTVSSLRDVTQDIIGSCKNAMDDTVYRRCSFVVEENDRVLKACTALEQKELKLFGSLMFEAHEGLRTKYEVSCEELDYLVELVKDNPYVYGARMMGGGFGGCTINLIQPEKVDDIGRTVTQKYKKKFGIEPPIYRTVISSGTQIITTNENAKT